MVSQTAHASVQMGYKSPLEERRYVIQQGLGGTTMWLVRFVAFPLRSVLDQIDERIEPAAVIGADRTGRNPNVTPH